MSLNVHHLHLSQSERIVWLLEEMQVPYKLTVHERDPTTGLSPSSLRDINPAGTAPYLVDSTTQPAIKIGESGAIIQYILDVYGPKSTGARLSRHPIDTDYVPYITWFHYANGSLQAGASRLNGILMAGVHQSQLGERLRQKLAGQLQTVDDSLSKTKFLAGNELTAADVMTVFTLTTMRGFYPYELGPYKNILRYLKDIASRPAYREALRKGDHGMEPLVEPVERRFTQFAAVAKAQEKF